MRVVNLETFIPRKHTASINQLEQYFKLEVLPSLPNHMPIRFVSTRSDKEGFVCEIDYIVFEKNDEVLAKEISPLFEFRKRSFENTDKFTAALIIPTGIGAEIGGQCGDGNVAARLIASACDKLITHPNVVNASDINEMTENTLYVEGSILTRFIMGTIGLQEVRSNRVLMLMDKNREKYFNDEVINAVSSARVTLGIDCDVLEIEKSIEGTPNFTKSNRASGNLDHLERLFKIIERHKDDYDAIGLTTIIDLNNNDADKEYFTTDQEVVNPWGGIEAMLTHSVSEVFKIPSAHSPMSGSEIKCHIDMDLGVIDPRKAPETASVTYLHCILKGLHKSPRITSSDKGLNVEHLSCMIIPDGCIGLPVLACLEQGIPIIAVKNKNRMKNDLCSLGFKPGKLFFAENYLEAAGIMSALKSGVSIDSLARPIAWTKMVS